MTERAVPQTQERSAAGGAEAESYDGLVTRLEHVVSELESGQLTLEQSVERFAEGVRLAREASRKLDGFAVCVKPLIATAPDKNGIVLGAESVVLIEWGEKFARFQEERDVEIAIERVGEDKRRIVVSG